MKKLSLSKETVRELSTPEEVIGGGMQVTSTVRHTHVGCNPDQSFIYTGCQQLSVRQICFTTTVHPSRQPSVCPC